MTMLTERAKGVIVRHRDAAWPGRADGEVYERWTLGAILAVMVGQILFLLVGCDWDFSGDEAEFWAWSRRLDWSYFARGPLIALVIRLGTELAGGASLALS